MRPVHPADLSPEERLGELARLLATALSRLRAPRSLAVSAANSAVAESSEKLSPGLELPLETRLSVIGS
jgi:hypothetical protein